MEIVNNVITGLNDAGLNAQAAYPGGPMAAVTATRTAVNLEKVDYKARTATVLVTVLVPASAGGAACETAAAQAAAVVEGLGGQVKQEACQFQAYADAYFIRVLATFTAGAVQADWALSSQFSLSLGSAAVPNAVLFEAKQETKDLDETPLASASWSFKLVDEYGRGEQPPAQPAEPFDIVVNRSGARETYKTCYWLSQSMENTATGMRRVRTGVAASRLFMSVV